MRISLLIVLILSLLGGIGAIIAIPADQHSTKLQQVVVLICLLALNSICALYLYKRAPYKNKTEWALFGFVGNISAIMIYHYKNYVKDRWSKGQSIFRN
jgi:uncharacterized membrane protein YsdA (DUF1294 family)